MTAALPEPFISADVDLRDFPRMPFDVARLRRSRAWLLAKKSPELGFYMMNLWMASWHEMPPGSLEDDDEMLMDQAICDSKRWPGVRELVLRNWVKCSDQRLHHRTVADLAMEAWATAPEESSEGPGARQRRWRQKVKRLAGLLTGAGISVRPGATVAELTAMCEANVDGFVAEPPSVVESRRLDVSASEWNRLRVRVFARDRYRCVYCTATDRDLHCDHVIALAAGGKSVFENLVTACDVCNLSKGSKSVQEWLS